MNRKEFFAQLEDLGRQGKAWDKRAGKVSRRVFADRAAIMEAFAVDHMYPMDEDGLVELILSEETFQDWPFATEDAILHVLDEGSRELREPLVSGADRERVREVIADGISLTKKQVRFVKNAPEKAGDWIE